RRSRYSVLGWAAELVPLLGAKTAPVRVGPATARGMIISPLSLPYMRADSMICRSLFMHCVALAFCLAAASAGNSIAARMAMMAMTTSNSMRVKAGRLIRFFEQDSFMDCYNLKATSKNRLVHVCVPLAAHVCA